MERPVTIRIDKVTLDGELERPEQALGMVIFAHGSGSSRLSPRNRLVSRILHQAGIGTLLFDLLTLEEGTAQGRRFDIDLLAHRLVGATRWLMARPEVKGLGYAYFGASTGAAAALQAAALEGAAVKAVVSRGGRPDLAMRHLERVSAPTLLIVGEQDRQVLHLNRLAFVRLAGEKELAVVPGATHLFEEPGTLEQAAKLARDWFVRYLGPP
jgi:putative phosphoribosyl transferase